jgi:UDP-N-acetylmuramoyl-L-alanyl-D-glutamate--2,6-diaminopimelate ligase
MVDAGDQAAVMEVSSHALALGRANGISFAAVAFTNLTQDHLDFHHSLEDYFSAKSTLFLDPRFTRNRPLAVINVDDAFGRILAERITPDRLFTFSVELPHADLAAASVRSDAGGSQGELLIKGRAAAAVARNEGRPVVRGDEVRRLLRIPLVGGYNVSNVLCALGIGIGLGLELDGMLTAVSLFPGVPGRLERVDAGQDFGVFVDYAHTPDSVANVLGAMRQIVPGRLIAVLGCGGDRDRGKRPLMGAAGEREADVLVVTSDNPRSEDPRAIIEEIVAGLEQPSKALVEVDRRKAIELALSLARRDDAVLVLGKGHERGQEFAAETVPFDDKEVAAQALLELGKGR